MKSIYQLYGLLSYLRLCRSNVPLARPVVDDGIGAHSRAPDSHAMSHGTRRVSVPRPAMPVRAQPCCAPTPLHRLPACDVQPFNSALSPPRQSGRSPAAPLRRSGRSPAAPLRRYTALLCATCNLQLRASRSSPLASPSSDALTRARSPPPD
jgi:hypothetical protein